MIELLLVGLLSCSLALILTPLIRDAALRLAIVDLPDGKRKLHRTPVPRIGGVCIAASYVASLLVLFWVNLGAARWRTDSALIGALVLASFLVFATGLVDDLLNLKPWQKVAGEIAAAAVLCLAGLRISTLAGAPVSAWIGVPLTFLWLVVCTNAFNLIDGLDGLASGMGLFATLAMLAAALLTGSHTLALATVPLAGSLVGFLRYNFNPASVFLGDCGSLLIGFLLGSFALVWSQKSVTLLGMAAPLTALAIPLVDVGLSIVRRWLRGHPILRADRSHIHHKLLERGLSHRRAVLVLYGLAFVLGALALAQSIAPVGVASAVAVLFCIVAWAGIRKLGYLEFGCALQAVSPSAIRRSIRSQIIQAALMRDLLSAESDDARWRALADAAAQTGFSQARGELAGRRFGTDSELSSSGVRWDLRVQLDTTSYVQVGRAQGSQFQSKEAANFAQILDRQVIALLLKYSRAPTLGVVSNRAQWLVARNEPASATEIKG